MQGILAPDMIEGSICLIGIDALMRLIDNQNIPKQALLMPMIIGSIAYLFQFVVWSAEIN